MTNQIINKITKITIKPIIIFNHSGAVITVVVVVTVVDIIIYISFSLNFEAV